MQIYFAVLLMNLIPAALILVLPFAFLISFHAHTEVLVKDRTVYLFILACFWTAVGLKVVLTWYVTFKKSKI
jgi:hypothetical protein